MLQRKRWKLEKLDSTHVLRYRIFVQLRVASLSLNAPENLSDVRILEISCLFCFHGKWLGKSFNDDL